MQPRVQYVSGGVVHSNFGSTGEPIQPREDVAGLRVLFGATGQRPCESSRRRRRTPTSRRRSGPTRPSLRSSISGSPGVGYLVSDQIRNLTSIVERHLKPGLGDILVGDLTAAIVDEFYEDLRSAGRMDGKPLAVGTVRRIHSALHAALAQAQRWSWVFENVADHATPPRDDRPRCGLPRQDR